MDKTEAKKRLDTIMQEAEKLKEIIDEKIKFDVDKNYVFIDGDGIPYLMVVGNSVNYFRFHSFTRAIQGFSSSKKTEQDCLDCHAKNGDIYEFDGCIPAIEFFLEKRKEYEGK